MRSPPSGDELQEIVKAVRRLVEEEQTLSNLKCSTSDEFLLRFIRASLYNIDASFHLVKKYFKAKIDNPEAFIVQSPAANLKTLTRKDLGLPLKDRDKCGRRVLNIKFGCLDPGKENWTNIIQSMMMCLEAFSLEQDVQENGVVLIMDCSNFSLKIMKWATPHKIRTVLGFFQECIPLRFEAVHIINYPYIFNVFASALKPFMNEDTKRKIIWHNELTSLEQHIDKPKLPVDLGGELKPEEVERWYEMVLEKEELFAEFRKMGYMK
ncbi:clavesin-1-like [Macrosteles quadrilineatus]|uniref:clavesin-1-like n=1 Tax=Macrosteles quadrilineatus TaxID=74068 RepID=UPI0023E11623|nr:clavesin-1-like [Macrosteles quadrilineatus]